MNNIIIREANRNTKQLIDFYTDKDMNVLSTRLFRQISGN